MEAHGFGSLVGEPGFDGVENALVGVDDRGVPIAVATVGFLMLSGRMNWTFTVLPSGDDANSRVSIRRPSNGATSAVSKRA